MNVIIGVDPHKATHTAVALDGNEVELGEVKVRANASQLKRLLAWAAPFEERTWAVEARRRLRLPAVPAARRRRRGRSLDVPATLAARVRVLGTGGRTRTTRTTRARSRSPRCAHRGSVAVRPADHASVLRLLAKRNNQLGEQPDPDRVSAARAARRARSGRISPRNSRPNGPSGCSRR